MKRVLLLILLVMLVSGCAPDPRQQAQAEQIRSQAQQKALDDQEQRQYQAELNQMQMQKLELEQQQRNATAEEKTHGLNMLLHYGALMLTGAMCFILFMAARSIATSFATATEGISKAMVRAAEVRANSIRLDPETRQYPVFLQYLGNGRFSAVNLNVNSVLLLDTRNEPDRQMISAMGATQYAGALAQEARQAADPTGVALIQAPVIDVKSELLSIGKDMVRNNE